MGGDEFVMACVGCADFDTLQIVADNLLERLRTPLQVDDVTLVCSASIGIALSHGEYLLAEDLVKSADFALYEAKVPGNPRIARYDADLRPRRAAETALMEELYEPLAAAAILFHFQPFPDANTANFRPF